MRRSNLEHIMWPSWDKYEYYQCSNLIWEQNKGSWLMGTNQLEINKLKLRQVELEKEIEEIDKLLAK